MPKGFFDVLQDDNSSESSISDDERQETSSQQRVSIPTFDEDLSQNRTDEETVLQAVYGDDFSKEGGGSGRDGSAPRLMVNVRPPDTDQDHIGSQLTLWVRLGKKYPYVLPKIKLKNVLGLSIPQQEELLGQLTQHALELSKTGSVMMCELVQMTEDYLLAHNRDPKTSAWELMKKREAMEQEKERRLQAEQQEEINRLLDVGVEKSPKNSTIRSEHSESQRFQGPDRGANSDVKKELNRQMEALEDARRMKQGHSLGFDAVAVDLVDGAQVDDGFDDYSDKDTDDDDDPAPETWGGSSRYKTDFIELGVLGRGGGGEVVKVRNRLDRRIYAIKKIILEYERGKFAKAAAIQNRKLRREVTTISRMTHKNIVRYYQAWVEGGDVETIDEAAVEKDENLIEKEAVSDQDLEPDEWVPDGDNDGRSESDSEESRRPVYWAKPPISKFFSGDGDESGSSVRESSSEGSSEDAESSDEEDEFMDLNSPFESTSGRKSLHSTSMENLLEHENDYGLAQSPLLAGLGFQSRVYKDYSEKRNKKLSSTTTSDNDPLWDESSSVKVGPDQSQRILYIQMEYCSSTLRKLIDDGSTAKMGENEIWRLVRQVIEALVYIHKLNIIHRDLKPGNIFLDAEGNVRLGDFGLATRKRHVEMDDDGSESRMSEAAADYEAIEDISRLLGGAAHTSASHPSSAHESLTGGVGTTFYRAPEQEGLSRIKGTKNDSYNIQADIFSFGIILFEMFNPPFGTYMERAETLTKLRGDPPAPGVFQAADESNSDGVDRRVRFAERFPPSFVQCAPANAQKIILWCLARDPSKRPTAEDLLTSNLIPRKIEVEQHYLEEALQLLTNSQSESYKQILAAMFNRPTPDVTEVTYDTDIAIKANSMGSTEGTKRSPTPSETMIRAILDIRAGSIDTASLQWFAMNASSMVAAASALQRARLAGKIGKGGKGILKRSTQRAAGIVAMRAAASAAVTGALDGVHGSDPLVVESVCDRLCNIFQSHGAVHLKSPLLRPRPASSHSLAVGGPAELIDTRGTVLLLPEDLTGPFARAVGRGGSSASNIKRYDIDRIHHKALAGGHPREALEATFDIVVEYDAQIRGHQIEAEIILAVSQVIAAFQPGESPNSKPLPFGAKGSLWFLRLSHTRLADSILEICGVPQKESLRRMCLTLLTQSTAPAPRMLAQRSRKQKKKSRRKSVIDATEQLERQLAECVQRGLPPGAADKLSAFITRHCMPLPCDAEVALESVQTAVAHLRSLEDAKARSDPRRIKRFEDVSKSVDSLRCLVACLKAVGVSPLFGNQTQEMPSRLSRPLYISLDLGLRQRRKHYHGQLIFQCIIIPDKYLNVAGDSNEDNNMLVSSKGNGVKIAEGGRYDDLVRKYRPPGNFGSAIFNHYTTAPIPMCAGVRFSVGKLVELVYLEAALLDPCDSGESYNGIDFSQKFSLDKQGMEFLRQSLGHPLKYSTSVKCIVSSMHGLDSASASERLIVAARLWADGISAEYMPQSGVMLSLRARFKDDSSSDPLSSDWSLHELLGVCAIMSIPFVVIVQPHLLKEKGTVRLRRVLPEDMEIGWNTGIGSNEQFVALSNLAGTIRDMSAEGTGTDERTAEEDPENLPGHNERHPSFSGPPQMECIYIDQDQYFSNDKSVSKSDTSNWKGVLKAMKNISQRAESFLACHQAPANPSPVFAVPDLPFWVIRQFGTELMNRERKEQSAVGASVEVTERFPKGKRALKTLAMALDYYMKRRGLWGQGGHSQQQKHSSGSQLLTIFLYSRMDDRFDMVTLEGPSNANSKKR